MTGTEATILNATIEAVSQYGMRRTSMNDIAERAGVSRQTVYNSFGSKDEIFRAALVHLANLSEQRARQQIESASDITEQIDAVFQIFVIEPFKLNSHKNDREDILADAETIAKDALEAFHVIVKRLYTELFEPFAIQLSRNAVTPESLADQVEIASRGFKKNARSLKHLKELLNVQKMLVLSMIET